MNRLFTIGKEEQIRKKSHHGMEPTVTRLDIITLYNPAWKDSFGDVVKSLNAIAARGWGPLNYFLLDDPEVVNTMEVDNLKKEYTEKFGKYYGQLVPTTAALKETLA